MKSKSLYLQQKLMRIRQLRNLIEEAGEAYLHKLIAHFSLATGVSRKTTIEYLEMLRDNEEIIIEGNIVRSLNYQKKINKSNNEDEKVKKAREQAEKELAEVFGK